MTGLRELVGRLKLLADIDIALVDLLQDHSDRIEALEALCKRQQGLIDGHAGKIFKIQELLGQWRSDRK